MRTFLLTIALVPLLACGGSDPGPPDAAPPDPPDASLVPATGEACSDDLACSSGECVETFGNGEPFGLCTETCTWDLGSDGGCYDGATCIRYNPAQEFWCLPVCEDDTDCHPGWGCLVMAVGVDICVPDTLRD